MGATVTHLPSLVMYFQVSVVDQVLVFKPREPPVRKTRAHIQKSDRVFLFCIKENNAEFCSEPFIKTLLLCAREISAVF